MDNQSNNQGTTDTTRALLVLVSGHQYKAVDGTIHTLTKVDDPQKINDILGNIFNFLMVCLAMGEKPNFDMPKEQPDFFSSDKNGMFYMAFRNGIPGVFSEDTIEEHPEIGRDFLVEDVTGQVVTTEPAQTTAPEKSREIVLLSQIKEGDIFTLPWVDDVTDDTPTYRRTGVENIEEVGSIVCVQDEARLMGYPGDEVLVVSRAEPQKPKVYPLRLPLVSGRQYVTCDGRVTAEAKTVSSCGRTVFSVKLPVDGGLDHEHRDININTGEHYYGDTNCDLVGEAQAPEEAEATV